MPVVTCACPHAGSTQCLTHTRTRTHARTHSQLVAGDGFTAFLSPSGAVYACGQFKDDVGSLAGFAEGVKVARLATVVYEPSSAKQKVGVGGSE